MNDCATVSFLVTALGIGCWVAAWRDDTRLLPWNRRYNAAHPSFHRFTLVVKRVGFWAIAIGLSNFVLAVILIQVTS